MKFEILTIFPEIIMAYTNESILKHAQKNKLVSIKAHDLRRWTRDKHRSVDGAPYGGGPGMVFRADVLARAVNDIKKSKPRRPKGSGSRPEAPGKTRVVLFSPAGKKFTQKDAERYVKRYNRLILLSGRYEGIDERAAKHLADEVVSIGDYVLSGGELPSMVVVDSVSRLVPGVLGKKESEESKRFGVGVPVYTRPEIVEIKGKKRRVPKVLLSGDHKRIKEWRKKHKKRT